MLGDLARDCLIERNPKIRIVSGALIDINSKPLPMKDEKVENWEDLRWTNFAAFINCKPSIKKKYENRKYLINCDIFTNRGHRYRFGSLEDLQEQAKKIKELAFVLRWTNIEEKYETYTRICDELKNIPFAITMDMIGYREYLEEQIKAKTGSVPARGVFAFEEVSAMNDTKTEMVNEELLNRDRESHRESARRQRARAKNK